jgi:3-deoxy-D-manno-octulosonic-acid transferase
MQNFKDVAHAALQLGASVECASPQDLAVALNDLLDHPDKGRKMGQAGKAFVEANAGASRRYALAIEEAANAD